MKSVWNNPKTRSIILQVIALVAVFGVLFWLGLNTAASMKKAGIASGFGFLAKPTGFSIIQHLIPYDEASTYGRAFVVALLNTLLVAVVGIVLATILGFLIGIARLSHNVLVSWLALAYVETVRNIPLLLQLFVWYFAVLRFLPGVHESYHLGDWLYLNVRGLYGPVPVFDGGLHWEKPVLGRFDFTGGFNMLPELVAMVLALTIYTASFIAEIVRAGILSVSKGQTEASQALGLSRWQTLRLVVVPQALRVVVPPMTSQYLNLTKNTSLAAAIAYPDLVLVFAGTVLLQTGQAVEVVAMTMGVFLLISIAISLGMNRYNRSIMLKERL